MYDYYSNNLLQKLRNCRVYNPADNTAQEVIYTYEYQYDNANNMIQKADPKGVTSYQYDELNRLTQVSELGDKKVTRYGYDVAGNRSSEAVEQNGSVVSTAAYDYNAQNRLKSITTALPDGIAETVLYYSDNNGNILGKTKESIQPQNANETRSSALSLIRETDEGAELDAKPDAYLYEYDDLNRLTVTRTGGQTVVNTYNGEGRRAVKSVDGQVTAYVYRHIICTMAMGTLRL